MPETPTPATGPTLVNQEMRELEALILAAAKVRAGTVIVIVHPHISTNSK